MTVWLKSSQFISPEKRKGIMGIPSGLPRPKSSRKRMNTNKKAIGKSKAQNAPKAERRYRALNSRQAIIFMRARFFCMYYPVGAIIRSLPYCQTKEAIYEIDGPHEPDPEAIGHDKVNENNWGSQFFFSILYVIFFMVAKNPYSLK